ncbi:MAG: hypothetical protein COX49_07635 [bacterium (Candidatus Stahlbacteria) CG23_combo_of_CG06-09_8_20_14_all_40_9]|nr:MAG: hypothetical protein COX49_07635 [bacterium (Candidatus Stahlbacteria) CG23_combo_of_CG06-09_8_20_14_all_40_9]
MEIDPTQYSAPSVLVKNVFILCHIISHVMTDILMHYNINNSDCQGKKKFFFIFFILTFDRFCGIISLGQFCGYAVLRAAVQDTTTEAILNIKN